MIRKDRSYLVNQIRHIDNRLYNQDKTKIPKSEVKHRIDPAYEPMKPKTEKKE